MIDDEDDLIDAVRDLRNRNGITLNSTAHPIAPWWKRLWLRIRRRDLNPASLDSFPVAKFYEVPSQGWCCFHCGEQFPPTRLGEQRARFHFGQTPERDPHCTVTAKQFRAMEDLLRRYREEDTDLHRLLRQAHLDRRIAVARAEETGYERGLRDQHKGTAVYVFMHQRPTDKQAWPVLYQDKAVAEACKFRVSEMREVHVPEVEERLLARMVADYLAKP